MNQLATCVARRAALGLGLAAAFLHVALASVRIEGQGPYYDELHQATGAFTWLGEPPPPFFCISAFDRVCVLNMTYSGALKTNLYGLYLRLVEPRFTLASWRMLGVVLTASGIVLFSVLARRTLSLSGLAAFLALFVTDITILLASRFDWGPVAMSLMLRMILLGVWMRSEMQEGGPSVQSSFALGAFVGLAVFEKLSGVVLIPPLAILLAASPGRRAPRHFLAAAAGLALGSLPLTLINAWSLLEHGSAVSSVSAGPLPDHSPSMMFVLAREYLRLGQGGMLRAFMLGLSRWRPAELMEGALAVATLLGIAAIVLRRDAPRQLRLAGLALVSYGVIWIGLWLLPAATWVHHWILGTPLLYAAAALALSGIGNAHLRRFALVGAVLWAAVRLPGVVAVEAAFLRESASRAWDGSLAEVGKFAASHADEAVFIASDWGVATQLHCFSNGRTGLVYEPFWNYRGPDHLRGILRTSGRRVIYLVRLRQPPRVMPGATDRIERDIAEAAGVQEVAVDPDAGALREVLVRKFVVLPGS